MHLDDQRGRHTRACPRHETQHLQLHRDLVPRLISHARTQMISRLQAAPRSFNVIKNDYS